MTQGSNASKIFTDYISTRRILIADGAAAARAGLSQTLVGLGAKMPNIRLADSYEVASTEMQQFKPQVVLCDYDLGNGMGLNLLQQQRKEIPDSSESLFVLITGNNSQSAVARAAEEDVDTFILKPYTLEVLRNCITQAAMAKLRPSPYMKKIKEGRTLLEAGKPKEAKEIFRQAATLDPKPSLAFGYLGQAEMMEHILEAAKGNYETGLNYNKIHYKCITGLFDIQIEQKSYDSAYNTVKKISRYFPANPQRLTQVLRLAIMTKNYDDIERYYQIFTSIDARNDELIRYVCAALVVCGKFYLQANFPSRALELFKKAAATGSGRTKIIRELIQALCEFDMHKEAKEFLSRFPAETHKQADYLASEYLVSERSMESALLVDKGRKLIKEGIEDLMIYRVLIRHSVAVGLKDAADELIRTASTKWGDIQQIVQKDLAKKG